MLLTELPRHAGVMYIYQQPRAHGSTKTNISSQCWKIASQVDRIGWKSGCEATFCTVDHGHRSWYLYQRICTWRSRTYKPKFCIAYRSSCGHFGLGRIGSRPRVATSYKDIDVNKAQLVVNYPVVYLLRYTWPYCPTLLLLFHFRCGVKASLQTPVEKMVDG